MPFLVEQNQKSRTLRRKVRKYSVVWRCLRGKMHEVYKNLPEVLAIAGNKEQDTQRRVLYPLFDLLYRTGALRS